MENLQERQTSIGGKEKKDQYEKLSVWGKPVYYFCKFRFISSHDHHPQQMKEEDGSRPVWRIDSACAETFSAC